MIFENSLHSFQSWYSFLTTKKMIVIISIASYKFKKNWKNLNWKWFDFFEYLLHILSDKVFVLSYKFLHSSPKIFPRGFLTRTLKEPFISDTWIIYWGNFFFQFTMYCYENFIKQILNLFIFVTVADYIFFN